VAGMAYARHHGTKTGNAIGRPRRIFDRSEVVRRRDSGLSKEKIAPDALGCRDRGACNPGTPAGALPKPLRVGSLGDARSKGVLARRNTFHNHLVFTHCQIVRRRTPVEPINPQRQIAP
jgi:hypothetical protein